MSTTLFENMPKGVSQATATALNAHLIATMAAEAGVLSMGGRAEVTNPASVWTHAGMLRVLASVWIYDETGTEVLTLGEAIAIQQTEEKPREWVLTCTISRKRGDTWNG